jgi:nucleotide-binding universal stress UspA family protein
LRRALLGSTCDALIRGGDSPVLVLRDSRPDDVPSWQFGRRMFRRIVLPLDGTAHAEGGIAHAVAMARAMDAKLRLVRVVGPVVTSAVLGAFTMHPLLPYDEATVIRNDLAHEYLQSVVDRIDTGGPKLEVSTEVSLGTDPATAIIESCHRMSADLVVLPTHGRGASRLLVSAVGDRLMRDGPDAMLFVKAPGARVPSGLAHVSHAATESPVPMLVK